MKTATTKTAPLFLRKFGPLLGAIAFYALIMILRSADIINGYYMQVMLFAGVNVMMTASLNLVNGFTGQFCIGHAGFMSLGAYGSAVITTLVFKGTSVAPAAQIPVFLLGLLCGGIVAALVGCLIGIPSLKLKGDYLAIVTLAFGEIVRALLRLIQPIGGARGMIGIPNHTTFFWIMLFVMLYRSEGLCGGKEVPFLHIKRSSLYEQPLFGRKKNDTSKK